MQVSVPSCLGFCSATLNILCPILTASAPVQIPTMTSSLDMCVGLGKPRDVASIDVWLARGSLAVSTFALQSMPNLKKRLAATLCVFWFP